MNNVLIQSLREWMRENGLSAFIFPSTDPHCGEYVPDHWKAREWISGFNGSAGTAVVTLTRAALWTDSRYWLAAEELLADTPFEVVRCGRNLVTPKEVAEWLKTHPQPLPLWRGEADAQLSSESEVLPLTGERREGLGLNPWAMPADYADELERELAKVGWSLATGDPESALWTDRPTLSLSTIEIHPLQYAGQPASEKLEAIRASLAEADGVVITQLDEIAWTLNLRGSDVHCTPVFVAYLVVLPTEAVLYVHREQVTPEVEAYLRDIHVSIRPYEQITADISTGVIDATLGIQFDPSVTNLALATAICKGDTARRYYEAPSPVTPLRAIKNPVEIDGFREAMLRDGVAMVKFLKTLSPLPREGESLAPLNITEMGVDKLLTGFRAEQEGFRDISFDTIAGYGAHGAIVHYEATPETDVPLEPRGLLLLDSGGQYDCGTTDITRTIPLGPLTDEERRDYTLVLKGHIRLATAVFPEGTTGTQLDVLARYAMWQEHKNYGHGTGHGVGSYLSVHEGPHQFRMNYVPAPLQAGMTVTIEPGIYIAGSHGVRIENTMLITPHNPTPLAFRRGAGGEVWLSLSPLTLCPIDTRPIIRDMLLPDELDYLNKYHARVRDSLLPRLSDPADRDWLIAATQPLT